MRRRACGVPLLGIGLLMLFAGIAFYLRGRSLWYPVYLRAFGRWTVGEVIERYGPAAEERLRPHFERAGVAYPPEGAALLAFKKEKRLELWAQTGGLWLFVRSYRILAVSGWPGPKLREGDRQTPEGICEIVELNPNSSYHLSLKLNYPNSFDLRMARADGRANPGSDIFIHGKAVSIGCIAVGDTAIEELFLLAVRIRPARIRVVIAPNDLRTGRSAADPRSNPPWLPQLYQQIRDALRHFPVAAGE